jgi:uncharacterized protein (DUF2062 family)
MLYRQLRHLQIQLRRRLIIPLFRSPHPPEYTARGVFIGLLVALTPTVGIQMAIVGVLWIGLRALHSRFDFNLIAALAWTWVTNAVTAPFVYYAYIVTGRVMLGRWDELRGYATFADRFQQSLPVDAGAFHTVWIFVVNLFKVFGVPLFVGCVPWTVLGAWLGYRWSLKFTRIYQARRARRQRERIERREARLRSAAGMASRYDAEE